MLPVPAFQYNCSCQLLLEVIGPVRLAWRTLDALVAVETKPWWPKSAAARKRAAIGVPSSPKIAPSLSEPETPDTQGAAMMPNPATSGFASWRRVNVVAGYAVFGLPAALGSVAASSTLAVFGAAAIPDIVLPLIVVVAPLPVWIRYTCRRPKTWPARSLWAIIAVVVVMLFGLSPMWFWVVPVWILLVSEILRGAAFAFSSRPRPGILLAERSAK